MMKAWNKGLRGYLILAHVSHSKMNLLKNAICIGDFILILNRNILKFIILASCPWSVPIAQNLTVN